MNYWEYIRVEELLALQGGFDNDEGKVSNDETLFIVVHQIYELWFKLVLRELETLRAIFRKNPVPDVDLARAVRSCRRVIAIFEQAIAHFKLMETLTTRDYLEFRDRLIPASGFQSAQLREIEILMGLEDSQRIGLGREGSYKEALKAADGSGSPATSRVESRVSQGASFKDALYDWLSRTPIDGSSSQEGTDRFLVLFVEAHRKEIAARLELAKQQAASGADLEALTERYATEMRHAENFLLANETSFRDDAERSRMRRVRAAIVFLESYRELPRLSWAREIVDCVLEMEQAMLIWRQRHARMVERVIGRRTGTGGSSGVDYLDQTALAYRVFKDLWAARTLLLRKPSLPPLEHSEVYSFRVEDH